MPIAPTAWVVTLTAYGTTILSEVDHFVFGEPSDWSYGSGDGCEGRYDPDGCIHEHTAGATRIPLGSDLARADHRPGETVMASGAAGTPTGSSPSSATKRGI